MDLKTIEMLKKDLAKAVSEKDLAKIEEISRILNISEEQAKYFERGLTGFPTVDQVWLKHYREGAAEAANNIPLDKTVWDVIEEKLYEYYDIPAIDYFKNVIYKEDFIDNVYAWARTFKAMGVEENEVVPFYGPFFPDICEMLFALNMIGACPYFLKLAISPKALEEETRDSKVAVVFDEMWPNVAGEFSKDKFKKVLVATASQGMPSPKKEIVSFLSAMKAKKNKTEIPDDKKYVWLDDAKKISDYYTGDVKAPFVSNRPAFITSSSGTTVGGIVKGTVATNESTISQLYMGDVSGIQYYPGDKCLNHFPPTASTSLNALYLLALYKGMIVMLDPRVSEKDFYNQIMKIKPTIALTTGSSWEAFFNRVEKEMEQGKKFDFSFAKGWTVGGEGTDVRKFKKWNEMMQQTGAKGIYSGYGSSELFSAVSVETVDSRYDYSKKINSVGIPYAGINVGVFDKDGNELSYNQRGELRIKSKSAMKGYYNKPELTAKTIVDGRVCTGDLAEIDENGFLYIWGRVKDTIKLENGEDYYLFDVANMLKEKDYIDDAIVLGMPTEENEDNLVAHIVWRKGTTEEEKKEHIIELNEMLAERLPEEVKVSAYAEHEIMLPYSPTTLKKDKNKMSKQTSGYVQVYDGKLKNVEFVPTEDGKYTQNVVEVKTKQKTR